MMVEKYYYRELVFSLFHILKLFQFETPLSSKKRTIRYFIYAWTRTCLAYLAVSRLRVYVPFTDITEKLLEIQNHKQVTNK